MKALVVIAVVLAATRVHADPRVVAEKSFRAGERAYKAQNFEAAAADFDEAYRALPLPEIAFSAAQAHRRWYRVAQHPEDLARAMDLYRAYLAKVSQGGRVRDAADAISELTREYEKLAAEGKLGKAAAAALTRLGVSVAFADQTEHHKLAEIEDTTSTEPEIPVTATIDSNKVTPNAFTQVEPGPHVIHVSAPGYVPADKKVTAIGGGADMVDIELQPMPGHVTVQTEEGSRISIDGRARGTAPAAAIELAPGKHLLAVAHDGRELAGRDLDLTRGQELVVAVPLEVTSRRRAVRWVAGGAAVAGALSLTSLALEIYYDRSASSELDALRNSGDQPQHVLDDYNHDRMWRDRHLVGAWVTGGLAVGIGLTAAWLYYFDKPASEGVRVTPTGVAGHF